jgi:hypothetical protein
MSDDKTTEADKTLSRKLDEMGKTKCPNCGRILDRGDVAWNSASTEAGTDYSRAHIQCQACETEIADWWSWYPCADTFEEFVENVLPDWAADPPPKRATPDS